jgi:hypothetical protein
VQPRALAGRQAVSARAAKQLQKEFLLALIKKLSYLSRRK